MSAVAEQIQGLTSAEVQERLQRGERNRAALRPTRTYWQIIWANAFSLYNVVLFASFAALFAIRGPGSAVFPAAIVLINVVLGLVQEVRAKRALDRLAALSVRSATVRRDGKSASIAVEDVVRDDVIELHPGDAVVADGPVVASEGMQIDESQLTGESEYVPKRPGEKLTSGSFCVAGAGLMRAEGVGAGSYVNHLANVARAYKNTRSPLERNLDALVKILVPLMILLAPLTLLSGSLRAAPLGDSLENVVNLMSSLVPQGLIVFVSISFAYGVIRISRFNALVQRPNAIELMGHIRFLCADKTGTLTKNQLHVKDLSALDGSRPEELYRKLGLYLSNVTWQNRTVEAVASFIDQPHEPPTKIAETPFSSDRKWSSVTLPSGETLLLGAPEVLLGDSRLRTEAQQMGRE
ncbi:MAG: HAD-IC family P-type ATPase, partial [Anaerolineae bacterium]